MILVLWLRCSTLKPWESLFSLPTFFFFASLQCLFSIVLVSLDATQTVINALNSPHPVSIRSLILLPWSERKGSREKWELQDWHYLLYDDDHWSLFCCKMCSFLPSVFWKSSACWYHTPSISDTPQGRVCMSLRTCAKHLTKSSWLDAQLHPWK